LSVGLCLRRKELASASDTWQVQDGAELPTKYEYDLLSHFRMQHKLERMGPKSCAEVVLRRWPALKVIDHRTASVAKQAHDEHHDWIGIRRGRLPWFAGRLSPSCRVFHSLTSSSLLTTMSACGGAVWSTAPGEEATPTIKDTRTACRIPPSSSLVEALDRSQPALISPPNARSHDSMAGARCIGPITSLGRGLG